MFRIYNKYELERLCTLLKSLDGETLKFPLDIFRDAAAVGAIEYGEEHRVSYSYTDDVRRAVVEASEGNGEYRKTWKGRDQKFRSSIQAEELTSS